MRENRDATRPGFPQGRWYRSIKKLVLNAVAKKEKNDRKVGTVFVKEK